MIVNVILVQAQDEEELADEAAEALRLQRAAAEGLRPEDFEQEDLDDDEEDDGEDSSGDEEAAAAAGPETLGQAAARVSALGCLGMGAAAVSRLCHIPDGVCIFHQYSVAAPCFRSRMFMVVAWMRLQAHHSGTMVTLCNHMPGHVVHTRRPSSRAAWWRR